MSKTFDPVEAAKMKKPGSVQEAIASATQAQAQAAPQPLPQPPAPQPPVMEAKHRPAEPIAPTAAPPALKVTRAYRVVKERNISWNGHITRLPMGKRIEVAGYGGPKGIANLLDQGVELEALPD